MWQESDLVSMFHRTLIIAKSMSEHGTILNYDDMQMGRLHPLHCVLTVPVSPHYPIAETISQKMKEEMRDLGFTDFWDYFFNAKKIRDLREKAKQEKQHKKRHWLF